MITFIDRCRMYIKRSGGDPKEHFAVEMLKTKVLESLSPTDRKILNASLGLDNDLDKIIMTADSMVGAQIGMIGAVTDQDNNSQQGRYAGPMGNLRGRGSYGPMRPQFNGNKGPQREGSPGFLVCWNCNRPGHLRRHCREPIFYGNQENMGQYQNRPRFGEGARGNSFSNRPPLRDITNQFTGQSGLNGRQEPPPNNEGQNVTGGPTQNPPPRDSNSTIEQSSAQSSLN